MDEVSKVLFREDLYYRLAAFAISVAPLRQHKKDIQPLVQHFVEHLSLQMGKKIETIPQHTLDKLFNYSWPGNIRELRNVIERAVISTNGTKLQILDALTDKENSNNAEFKTMVQFERDHILSVLKFCKWRIEGEKGAAKILNMHPNTLRNRMIKLGIERRQNDLQD